MESKRTCFAEHPQHISSKREGLALKMAAEQGLHVIAQVRSHV